MSFGQGFGNGQPDWGPGGHQQQHPYHPQPPPQPPHPQAQQQTQRRSQQQQTQQQTWTAPDWEALAERTAAARTRRRRLLLIGGGALAAVAVGTVVALTIIGRAHDGANAGTAGADRPEVAGSPATSPPEPTFSEVQPPPPPDPHDYISDPEKDVAPLTPDTLFPDSTVSLDDRDWQRGASAATEDCASAAPGDLGGILTAGGCRKLLRTTYVHGRTAVTIGVAVFDGESAATEVEQQAKGSIQALSGGGVPRFCRGVVCLSDEGTIGRYVYFTIAGYTDGTSVAGQEGEARVGIRDGGEFAYRRIVHRGNTQASAAATAPLGERG